MCFCDAATLGPTLDPLMKRALKAGYAGSSAPKADDELSHNRVIPGEFRLRQLMTGCERLKWADSNLRCCRETGAHVSDGNSTVFAIHSSRDLVASVDGVGTVGL